MPPKAKPKPKATKVKATKKNDDTATASSSSRLQQRLDNCWWDILSKNWIAPKWRSEYISDRTVELLNGEWDTQIEKIQKQNSIMASSSSSESSDVNIESGNSQKSEKKNMNGNEKNVIRLDDDTDDIAIEDNANGSKSLHWQQQQFQNLQYDWSHFTIKGNHNINDYHSNSEDSNKNNPTWVLQQTPSHRSTCRRCGEFIKKDFFRIGYPVKDQRGDYGALSNWLHLECAAYGFYYEIEGQRQQFLQQQSQNQENGQQYQDLDDNDDNVGTIIDRKSFPLCGSIIDLDSNTNANQKQYKISRTLLNQEMINFSSLSEQEKDTVLNQLQPKPESESDSDSEMSDSNSDYLKKNHYGSGASTKIQNSKQSTFQSKSQKISLSKNPNATETAATSTNTNGKQDINPESHAADPYLNTPHINLLKFQKEGLYWMIQQEQNELKKGGILADQMGMGKTLQMLSLILAQQQQITDKGQPQVTLVVCPTAAVLQ